MKGTVLFITGIDTNIGKTFATGMIACALAEKGKKVITQKMIQTISLSSPRQPAAYKRNMSTSCWKVRAD